LESLQRLGQRDAAAPVQQVEIDAIRTQPLQAAFAGQHCAAARGVLREHFAHQEYFVAPAADGFGDQFLRGAVTIHLGGIDQRHAEVETRAQRLDFVGAPLAVFPQFPRALAQGGNAGTVWQ
jgi:hypothetical protein